LGPGEADQNPKTGLIDIGEVTSEKYDKLVLSPGAAPVRPPLPGIDLPNNSIAALAFAPYD
jgi:NADPH-dependent 2,4-dienoyl-CoA reductase/sulfur reductase-like enzyme